MTTPRYILIDNHSGFIFGDTLTLANSGWLSTGDAEIDATNAARFIDADVGEHGRAYQFDRAERARGNLSGYHVYDISEDAMPVVGDGQDETAITLAESGRYVGFVACEEDRIDMGEGRS